MKKWWIVLGTCLVLGLSVLGMRQVQQVQIVSAQTLHQHPVIIIDPGHGGMDGGAQANGVTEKDVNLAVSLTLRDLLSQQGFHVIMTREDDRSIHEEGLTQISRQKRSDMYQRLKIIEDHPEAIFISVHQNKFEQSSSRGAQIFYSQNDPQSKVLAQKLQDSFQHNLQPDNTRQIKPAENNLFLLYEAQIPAVMAECGFLSNPEEAHNLSTEQYQQQTAFTIYCGLMDYLQDESK